MNHDSSTTTSTLESEFQRIAAKYGYDDLSSISRSLDDTELQRKDARGLLMDLGKPLSQLNTRDVMRARGIGDKPMPRTADEAAMQAAMEVVMQILKTLFGIRTADDLERDLEQLEQTRLALNLERNHAQAIQMMSDAANDDEFRARSTRRRP
ncbi:hypothetical protein SR914_19450 [Comamonas testosteroni]|uniref:Uncharacterized protein n=1 Tax=Comamonas testosteroni (strain DSM 14576 / KF-1) TaxID=399795 RepID=B7WRH8_COMTK|nr:hypothetical protein [Comamonas testosteroni]EED67163.1 hypothetical protein CtesDRAFT_PD2109 [Comamonas testosteroni KF-1]WQG65348.1 hypothetical protein SR914_19450 [Comamonas testosteroni]